MLSKNCSDCGLGIIYPTVMFYCPTCDKVVCRKCSPINHFRHNVKKPNPPNVTETTTSKIIVPKMHKPDLINHIRNYQKFAGCEGTSHIAESYYQQFASYITNSNRVKLEEALTLMRYNNDFRKAAILSPFHSTPIDKECDRIVEEIKTNPDL